MGSKAFDVIAIGALLIDIIGKVEKLPKVNQEEFIYSATIEHGGSAANTAVACAKLGLKAGFIGKVGNDVFGKLLGQGLEEVGVDTSQLKVTDEVSTGICVAVSDRKDRRHMYAFSGAANFLSEEDIDEGYVSSTRLLHIADLLNIKPLIKAVRIASEAGAGISLNPGGLIASLSYKRTKPLFSSADVIVLSKHNARRIYGTTDFSKIARIVFKNRTQVLAITMGAKGCIVSDRKHKVIIPAYKTRIVDTTGAGDAFSAGLIYGLLKGHPIEVCGKYANAAAALCVSTPGARFKHSLKDIEELVRGGVNE